MPQHTTHCSAPTEFLDRSRPRLRRPARARGLPLGAFALLLLSPLAQAQEALRYDRDIRPLLADRCFRCHGPDAAARKADLRLDLSEDASAQRQGRPAIKPGEPDQSELWHRITTDDPDDAMPPAHSGRPPLSPEEQDRIRRWIETGAVYEPHWSFVPPERPALPASRDSAWGRSQIDAFVLDELEQRGLQPNPTATPEVLVRRLYLALTGLPPTPAETSAFTADPSPAAYDLLVDHLLGEEPYRTRHAEHMSRPWLDAARYADTCGIHMDAGRQIWPWRDWVLRAYRDNRPFDQFVTEQIAGDLLPDATIDQRVASGFNRNHVTTDEGGAISEEYLVEYAVDRTATTGAVFLGLTLGCARCHEHKYDPISQDEFYSFYAYFNSIEEPGLYSQQGNPNRAFEPFLAVPNAEQVVARQALAADLQAVQDEMATPPPSEAAEQQTFIGDTRASAEVHWAESTPIAAESAGGATMSILDDGSVKASGANPAKDTHQIRLATQDTDLRLLCLEAMPDPDHAHGRVGRAPNGNAVLASVEVTAISTADPTQQQKVDLIWAWASLEQANGDHRVINLLDDDEHGWAVDGHSEPTGSRTALLLSDQPFGYEGGTEVLVTLNYDSVYANHVFGRVRLDLGTIGQAGLEMLPDAVGGWFSTGPFDHDDGQFLWEHAFGPEQQQDFDRSASFGEPGSKPQQWKYQLSYLDGQVNKLADGTNVTYVTRRLIAPTNRQQSLSLGSDDGFRLFLDQTEVAGNQVARGVAADQDSANFAVEAGEHSLTMKIVNTGGAAGFYVRPLPRKGELDGVLTAVLLPDAARDGLEEPLRNAWRLRHSPGYTALLARQAELQAESTKLEASIPLTMVMKERAAPRPTYVLDRGEYDKPLKDRQVQRGIPASLGQLPEGAPDDRLGLAQWLMADDNPLVARVRMNRLWAQLFGTGIVKTVEDFGMQGEWPSHVDLLDWLAVEFRDSGWDLQHMLRLIVSSSTFRQQSRANEPARLQDPDNRLLAWFPRRRLTAEELRDQALYAAGILVERLGGPSVKPYQPAGLWREVAMTQSNTRTFQQGAGDDLFRRSIYTYYKRACPPPSMLMFDAPTREFCTTSRLVTNTPLQALALWNDEQMVEAARALAERVCTAVEGDQARLALMFQYCTGRTPSEALLQRSLTALNEFRTRYRDAEGAAAQLLKVGTRPVTADVLPAELAAFTMLANAVLNLDATICLP